MEFDLCDRSELQVAGLGRLIAGPKQRNRQPRFASKYLYVKPLGPGQRIDSLPFREAVQLLVGRC